MPTREDRPLSRDQAEAKLNRCLEEGAAIYSRHFRDELLNDDLSMQDVLTVCKSDVIFMAPEKDIKTARWKYRIEGVNADRPKIAVVFTFRTDQAVFITVFERAR